MLREAAREKARKANEALTPEQKLARINGERRRLERTARSLVDEKEEKPTLQEVKRDRLRATKAMIEETMKVGQVQKIEKLVGYVGYRLILVILDAHEWIQRERDYQVSAGKRQSDEIADGAYGTLA